MGSFTDENNFVKEFFERTIYNLELYDTRIKSVKKSFSMK
jgi:hypothetical protein